MIRNCVLGMVAAAACFLATASDADAQVRVFRGPNRTYVGVGRYPAYRAPYYGGGYYAAPTYYAPTYYSYGYATPYYSNYGYYGRPYYGGRRGAYFGPNGFVLRGPRGRIGVRY